MCVVLLEKPTDNVEFILYNHIFSQKDYRFTIDQLVEELKQYDLCLTSEYVENQINEWVIYGLIDENLNDFSISNR